MSGFLFDSEGPTDYALRAKLKQQHGLDVKYVQLDITDIASVRAAKEVIDKAEGRLDSLVNNAGLSGSLNCIFFAADDTKE